MSSPLHDHLCYDENFTKGLPVMPSFPWRGLGFRYLYKAPPPDAFLALAKLEAFQPPQLSTIVTCRVSTCPRSLLSTTIPVYYPFAESPFHAPADKRVPLHIPLAPISNSLVDLEKWETFDDDHITLFQLIQSPSAFESLFVRSIRRVTRRSKGIAQHHVDHLDSSNLTETLDSIRDAKTTLGAFLVWKKDLLARFILNARPINDAQHKPPDMMLPPLPAFLQLISRYRFGCTVDAVSAFYQFPVDPLIAKYFVFAFNNKRGPPKLRALRRLCMGWKFAPAICQRAMIVLCTEVVKRLPSKDVSVYVWLDNFVLLAQTKEVFDELQSTFRAVAADVNLQLHHFSVDPHHFQVLGLLVDMQSHLFSHSPEWLAKVQSWAPCTTLREATRLIGAIIFSYYVRRIHLATVPQLTSQLRIIAQAVADGKKWDSPFTPASWFQTQIPIWLTSMNTNFSASIATNFCPAYSDATEHIWAFQCGTHAEQGPFTCGPHLDTIFLKELTSAAYALIRLAQQGVHSVQLYVDNSAAAWALRSGHSAHHVGNSILRLLAEFLPKSFAYAVSWIPTDRNLSDKFTRGTRAFPGQFALPRAPVPFCVELGVCRYYTTSILTHA